MTAARCQHCPNAPADERSFMCEDCAYEADTEVQELREQVTIAEDALRAIVSPDCMISHDPEGGGWIDTEAPARIAEGALERMALPSRETNAPKET